jgi:8-oxo-dGTP pyrophosphatase MutT (NUDIX family)
MILRGDKILLSRRATSGRQGGQWELPGGAVDEDRGETDQQAAARETLEEIGLQVRIGNKLAEDTYRVRRTFQVHTVLFAAHLLDEDAEMVFDPKEVEAAEWFDFDQIPQNLNLTSARVILACTKAA